MKCHKNGRFVELTWTYGSYQLWSGDEWKCEGCDATVVCNYGREPMSPFTQSDAYEAILEEERKAGNLVVIGI
jgi:hypothetical protein